MPQFAEAANMLKDLGSSLLMAKLDADRYPKAASALEIKGFPTLLLFVNGVSQVYNGGFSAYVLHLFFFLGELWFNFEVLDRFCCVEWLWMRNDLWFLVNTCNYRNLIVSILIKEWIFAVFMI